ncbi:MAG: bifunctional metallophosphatase/5'-nucleotidase [Deltaproteobacteria bacterium]|jgi:5'-nucleotidase|nr:bifunctional metallophosphatase/5'-nucleotidase [Deltaproteobacteria bacterium]
MKSRLTLRSGFSVFSLITAFLSLLVLVSPALSDDPPTDGQLNLTILHTNDIHANYGGFWPDGRVCYQSLCEGGSGGTLRLERAIAAMRKEYPESILVDAGDQFQGTLFWRLNKETATVAVLNSLNYQFFVPGNHEFDGGINTFRRLLTSLNAQVLSANLTLSEPLSVPSKLKPWTIMEIEGRKVGFVGLTTQTSQVSSSLNSPESKSTATLSDEKTALTEAVKSLADQDTDIIILISHLGIDADKELAAEVNGIDVIVGGHSHTLLGEGLPRAQGPYPTTVNSPAGRPVLIVSSGSHGRYLGLLKVTFDEKGYPDKWSGSPIPVNDDTLAQMKAPAANKALAALLDDLALPAQNLMAEKIGQINVQGRETMLDEYPRICRRRECRTGDVVADSFLSYFPEAQIAVLNGGSIRHPLPVGEITVADVLSTLPFEDFVFYADISGQELNKIFEHSADGLPEGYSGKFLQVAGLKIIYEVTDQKCILKEIRYQDSGEWKNITPEGRYRLIAPDFIAHGGDGFQTLAGLKWTKTDQLTSDILAKYLKNGPVKADFEPRIIFGQENK